MKKLRRNSFNLLEIVASLLLVAFGVVAVMGILQPSIKSSRDSIGDNCAADVASQFMSYFEATARKSWTTVVGTSTTLTSSPPTSAPTISASTIETPGSWSGAVGSGNIYTSGGTLSSSGGIYGAKVGQDFSAQIKVWKSKINDFSYACSTTGVPTDKAIRVSVEVSYPANIPYSAREKRYYSLEIFNQ